jgi:hypothetical protein
MNIRLAHAVVATATCLAFGPVAAAANLLANGSFETPVVTANTYVLYGLGSTAITGWTVVGAGDIKLSNDPVCSDGLQCLDLTGLYGYGKGLRSDAVATVVGTTYQLSFDLGNYVPFGSSTVSVSFNNGAPALFTNLVNADPSNFEWESKSLTWVADATSTQITFLGAANGSLSNDAGILLDHSVFTAVAVPEAGSGTMLLAGLLAIVGLARRSRR